MKFRLEKQKRWSFQKTYVGRKNGYKIELIDNMHYTGQWFFSIHDTKSDFVLNSLWKDMSFTNYEDTAREAEKYVDSLEREVANG